MLFFTVAAPVYNLTNSTQGLPFLYIHTSTCYILSFDDGHSNRGDVISYYGFNFHFPND